MDQDQNYFKRKLSKKMFFITVFGFVFVFNISAQKESKTESVRLMELLQKLEGTYQIQVLNSRDKTEVPLFIMDSIQAKRHNTEVVYFPLKNNVRVMVLPLTAINAKDFKPLERVANIFTAAKK